MLSDELVRTCQLDADGWHHEPVDRDAAANGLVLDADGYPAISATHTVEGACIVHNKYENADSTLPPPMEDFRIYRKTP